MTIRAALLDERGVFLRMDEVADVASLTPRHLPQIVECDHPSGEYLWIPDERRGADGRLANAYGGAFWPLAWLRRVAATRGDASANRDRRGKVHPAEKAGVATAALVDFLNERGLA